MTGVTGKRLLSLTRSRGSVPRPPWHASVAVAGVPCTSASMFYDER